MRNIRMMEVKSTLKAGHKILVKDGVVGTNAPKNFTPEKEKTMDERFKELEGVRR